MRCDEVAASSPRRSTAVPRSSCRCNGTSTPACGARPSSPATARCCGACSSCAPATSSRAGPARADPRRAGGGGRARGAPGHPQRASPGLRRRHRRCGRRRGHRGDGDDRAPVTAQGCSGDELNGRSRGAGSSRRVPRHRSSRSGGSRRDPGAHERRCGHGRVHDRRHQRVDRARRRELVTATAIGAEGGCSARHEDATARQAARVRRPSQWCRASAPGQRGRPRRLRVQQRRSRVPRARAASTAAPPAASRRSTAPVGTSRVRAAVARPTSAPAARISRSRRRRGRRRRWWWVRRRSTGVGGGEDGGSAAVESRRERWDRWHAGPPAGPAGRPTASARPVRTARSASAAPVAAAARSTVAAAVVAAAGSVVAAAVACRPAAARRPAGVAAPGFGDDLVAGVDAGKAATAGHARLRRGRQSCPRHRSRSRRSPTARPPRARPSRSTLAPRRHHRRG